MPLFQATARSVFSLGPVVLLCAKAPELLISIELPVLDVVSVARAIKAVQPYLGETKLMEYGLGILRASKKFDIDASVLIAITQQETAFRPNLPEGRAGEHGICQIRKMWLKQPAFKREFKNPTISDLHRPAKSFLMAAWILRDLKSRVSNHKILPWWSYYNAVRFENRFKYYVAVNRNFAKLRKFQRTLENEAQYAENLPLTPPTPAIRSTPQLASPLGLPPASNAEAIFGRLSLPIAMSRGLPPPQQTTEI